MHGYQKGDKPKKGKPIDLGLSEQSNIEGGSAMKLRKETNDSTKRPVGEDKKISSDRGTFTSKC